MTTDLMSLHRQCNVAAKLRSNLLRPILLFPFIAALLVASCTETNLFKEYCQTDRECLGDSNYSDVEACTTALEAERDFYLQNWGWECVEAWYGLKECEARAPCNQWPTPSASCPAEGGTLAEYCVGQPND